MLRRSPRALGLWLGAAALAITTGALVADDLATLHHRARALGREQRAVVARRDLTLGSTITSGDITTRLVHASQLPTGVVTDSSLALGRVVRVPVVRDAFVAARNLAPHDRTGLGGVLPVGTRAMRVLVEDGLRPPVASAVDVYATFESDAFGTGRPPSAPATVVAAGVLVLATDDGGSGATGAFGVTLLVDEDQADDVAYASAQGAIVLALVPPEDAHTPGLRRR
jgi:Flp pilus assembly protein CpaB